MTDIPLTASQSTQGHLYFIGITGHAMRGLAVAAKHLGYTVTGLDEPAVDPGAAWVTEQGIEWWRSYDPSQLDGVTAVIVSGGTPGDYAPVVEAKHRGIPVQSFAELVGRLTHDAHVIGVAGTHGKTTTTALITWLLESAGRHPDYLIGIQPFNFPASARLTGADTFVVEADEYRASALDDSSKAQHYHPDTLVLTSVEHDHPDVFPDLASVVTRFKQIVADLPAETGHLVAWAENPTVTEVAESATCAATTYGLTHGGLTARDISFLPAGIEFDLMRTNAATEPEVLGRIAVPLYGRHNVLNSLAAATATLAEGLTIQQIIEGAVTFKGAYRRFNRLTAPDAPITVVDDYAHHPTEVATTLEGAKLHFPGHRIIAVFRPHTYSRTAALLNEYHQSFASADVAYITDIESARETGHKHTVSGQNITDGLSIPAHYIPDRTDLVAQITSEAQSGDVIVCMSVSGYDKLAEEITKKATT